MKSLIGTGSAVLYSGGSKIGWPDHGRFLCVLIQPVVTRKRVSFLADTATESSKILVFPRGHSHV